MHSAKLASSTHHPAHWREVARIGGAIIVAALAASVIIADLQHARLAAVILLGVWLEVRITLRLRRIEAQQADRIDAEHELYIRAYMDGLGGRGK